jgi:hypothetical protein
MGFGGVPQLDGDPPGGRSSSRNQDENMPVCADIGCRIVPRWGAGFIRDRVPDSADLRNYSLNKDKRTHLIYLGEKRLPMAKQMSENYKRLLEIVEEMTTINMALLKNDAI